MFDLWADEAALRGGTETIHLVDASSKPSRRSSTRESDEQLNEAKECDSVRYWILKP